MLTAYRRAQLKRMGPMGMFYLSVIENHMFRLFLENEIKERQSVLPALSMFDKQQPAIHIMGVLCKLGMSCYDRVRVYGHSGLLHECSIGTGMLSVVGQKYGLV